MATQTQIHDPHQTSTSDQQTKKLSEAVKVTEQINLCSPRRSVEEKGNGDNLHILDTILPTSEAKPVDEPPVSERPSNEPIGGEAIELPVIAFLENSIKEEYDAADDSKSPPEEQPTVEVIQKESVEVPAAASAQKVEEQPSEIVGLLPKVQDESSGDNTESSVMADSGRGPADAEEEGVTECIHPKEAENNVAEQPVEPQRKEGVPMEEMIGTAEAPTQKEQAVEVDSSKGLEEVIAKEISIPTEAPKEKEEEEEEAGEESREVIAEDSTESITASNNKEQQNEEDEKKELGLGDYETPPVVAGKSLVDLIAETKIEEPQVAAFEAANVSELEVKDEQIGVSNPTHKHSHNLLSKLKRALVKARKAIIGRSPTSKTLSSQPRGDIKVK